MEIQTHLLLPPFKSDTNERPRLLTTSPVLRNNLQTWGTALQTCATGQRTLTSNSVYLPCVSSGSCLWLFFLGYLCGIMRSQTRTGLTSERRIISQVMLRMTSTSDIQVSASFYGSRGFRGFHLLFDYVRIIINCNLLNLWRCGWIFQSCRYLQPWGQTIHCSPTINVSSFEWQVVYELGHKLLFADWSDVIGHVLSWLRCDCRCRSSSSSSPLSERLWKCLLIEQGLGGV